jgi:hypothetical protein
MESEVTGHSFERRQYIPTKFGWFKFNHVVSNEKICKCIGIICIFSKKSMAKLTYICRRLLN